MSRKLTLSSIIACSAMAVVAFAYTPESAQIGSGEGPAVQQAEFAPSLPTLR